MTVPQVSGWEMSQEAEHAAATVRYQAARRHTPCTHCGQPVGWDFHTPHRDGCDQDGCTCDDHYCPECCPECHPGRLPLGTPP